MGLLQLLPYIGSGQVVTGGGGGSFTPLIAATIKDDGYYNGFPFPHQLSDGTIVCVYKKSADHASKGPMTIARSTNGGTSWTEAQLTIGVTAIECAALSFIVHSTGRWCVAYQDDILYTSIKFAYSDDDGATWTASTTINLTAGYSSSPSPIKMIEMPSGKIRCCYYEFSNTGSNPATVGFINSTNTGVSWAIGETICANTEDGTAGTLGNWRGHEAGVCITHNTGTDATCKMIALIRVNIPFEGGTYYMFYKSSDGGSTWATDFTTDAGSFVDDNGVTQTGPFSRHLFYRFLLGNSPLDIFLHNGLVYVVNGERNPTYGFALKYTTATPDNAFQNAYNTWAAPTQILAFNAVSGQSIHCGYPVCFEDYQGKLWAHYYDVSLLAENGSGSPRCFIRQVKIAD